MNPKTPKYKITAILLEALIDFASFRGMNPSDLRKLTSDTTADFCSKDMMVDAELYLKVLKEVSDSLNDSQLGLTFGSYLNLSALGIVHSISLRTNSVQQAFLLLDDYLKSNFPLLSLERYQENNQLHIILNTTVEDTVLRELILESSFCIIFRELSLMIDASNLTLNLPNQNRDDFEERLNVPIQKGESYTFSMHMDLVNKTINSKNLRKIETLLPQYMQMVMANRTDKSFAAITKNMILHLCSPELPSLQEVSAQFAMSSRTFQRKLTKEGSSFRDISNTIKKEIAVYLREGNKMKTQDIAYILGYSESSAYLNALKTWNIN